MKGYRKAAQYTLDLSKHPSERWHDIAMVFRPLSVEIRDEVHKALKSELGRLKWVVLACVYLWICLFGKLMMHIEEIRSIAKIWEIDVHVMWLMQYMYEASTFCTTVTTQSMGRNVMFRTLDWELTPILKKLTIDLKVVNGKDGDVLFYAPTWIGYVGFLTACVPQCHSVAINFRECRQTNRVYALWRMLMGHWSIGYLLRDTLEHRANFNLLKSVLWSRTLISPCYITLCSNQGSSVITRYPYATHNKKINERNNDGYLVQTNIDFDDITSLPGAKLHSWDRRKKLNDVLRRTPAFASDQKMIATLMKPPVLNDETIFVTVMAATTERPLICIVK